MLIAKTEKYQVEPVDGYTSEDVCKLLNYGSADFVYKPFATFPHLITLKDDGKVVANVHEHGDRQWKPA